MPVPAAVYCESDYLISFAVAHSPACGEWASRTAFTAAESVIDAQELAPVGGVERR